MGLLVVIKAERALVGLFWLWILSLALRDCVTPISYLGSVSFKFLIGKLNTTPILNITLAGSREDSRWYMESNECGMWNTVAFCGRLNNDRSKCPHPHVWNLWVLPCMAKGTCRCNHLKNLKMRRSSRWAWCNYKDTYMREQVVEAMQPQKQGLKWYVL